AVNLLRTGCADLIEAAGLFRLAHRQAVYMHANRFTSPKKLAKGAESIHAPEPPMGYCCYPGFNSFRWALDGHQPAEAAESESAAIHRRSECRPRRGRSGPPASKSEGPHWCPVATWQRR